MSENPGDLGALSLLELFRLEVEMQSVILNSGLLALERGPNSAERLQELMRAAHSLKGAARIVNRDVAVRLAHAMEDCFVWSQRHATSMPSERMDHLFRAVDLLSMIAQLSDNGLPDWQAKHQSEMETILTVLSEGWQPDSTMRQPEVRETASTQGERGPPALGSLDFPNRTLRVDAASFNVLVALAGESQVAARWLNGITTRLLNVSRVHLKLTQSVGRLRESLGKAAVGGLAESHIAEIGSLSATLRRAFSAPLEELESFDRHLLRIADHLHHEVLSCRMRPFREGVRSFPRLVRDLAGSLGKNVELKIAGETTPVDRDILERLEGPLGHLLRNAIDHGIESPQERRASGKPEQAVVRLEARHGSGMLLISLFDDGCGIDAEAVRQTVVEGHLTSPEVASRLSHAELLEFLFLPGFSMKKEVTEVSGRGVGLDVVRTFVDELRGAVRVSSQPGQGTSFELKLPLTLSLVRALVADVAGALYAFPLAGLSGVMKCSKQDVESLEGRQFIKAGDQRLGLVAAQEVLNLDSPPPESEHLEIILLGEATEHYGLVVNRLVGEQDISVRSLDPRLGKIKDISGAGLTQEGAVVFVVEVEHLTRSIEAIVRQGPPTRVTVESGPAASWRRRILVVEDSLTVRELERKLLQSEGYHVDLAVDGMEGWNAAQNGEYDLIVTDVDMPRLDGIRLVTMLKNDPRLRSIPVIIVSYKSRPEDRVNGLEAGADYYLSKESFHDESLLRAVADLIGEEKS